MITTYYQPSVDAKAGDTVTFEFLDNAQGTIKHFEVHEDASVKVVVVMNDDGRELIGSVDDLCKAPSA